MKYKLYNLLYEARINPARRDALVQAIKKIAEHKKIADIKLSDDAANEILDTLLEADPTPKGKYINWVIFKWFKQNLELYGGPWLSRVKEDLYKVSEPLQIFWDNRHIYKNNNINTDINAYSGIKEIKSLTDSPGKKIVRRLANRPSELVTKRDLINGSDARLIYEDSDRMLIDLLTYEASKFYSTFTSWCTARRGYFENYSNNGPLIVDIDKNITAEEDAEYGETGYEEVIIDNIIQFNITGDIDDQQIMDADDKPIDADKYIDSLSDSAKSALLQYFKENYSELALNYEAIKDAINNADSVENVSDDLYKITIESKYDRFARDLDEGFYRLNRHIEDLWRMDLHYVNYKDHIENNDEIEQIVKKLINSIYPNNDPEEIYDLVINGMVDDEIKGKVPLEEFIDDISAALISFEESAVISSIEKFYSEILKDFLNHHGFIVEYAHRYGAVLYYRKSYDSIYDFIGIPEEEEGYDIEDKFNRRVNMVYADEEDYSTDVFRERLADLNNIYYDILFTNN